MDRTNSIEMIKSRLIVFLIFLLGSFINIHGQGTAIPQSDYTIQSFSTNNNINVITRAFDADSLTFWALGANNPFPAFVEIDLGDFYDVNGFSFLPRPDASNRPGGYEIYLSSDGMDWGTPEISGDMPWDNDIDASRKDIFFGAITARFVRVVYTYSLASNGNIHTADLFIYESLTPATGQENQAIDLSISNKSTADAPFQVSGTATSGLPLTYSIESGPATINGNTINLDGTAGTVVVRADQAGDSDFYPATRRASFEVIDLSIINPEIFTRLTEAYPVEMNELIPYPIYMTASIGQPSFLNIASVKLNIDGEEHTAEAGNGHFYFFWTPSSYGTHTIEMIAQGTNGNETSITRTIEVSNSISSRNITTISNVDIIFGGANSRVYTGVYRLPQSVGAYDNITAYLDIQCPNITNGCDDWDRLANIDIKGPDGNWIQVIRYITPFGVACDHEIDLTDYASLLQGEFEFRMFIDTWGTGGWNINLDFDFQAGTPAYNYSVVDEIWDGRFSLGDPQNLQPVNTFAYEFPANTEESKLIISNTGHGWGENNTFNAAEFYNARNFIDINGEQTFTQNLWNTCNPNPDNCTGQLGTWAFNRAGWCPGAIAHPSTWSLDPYISTSIDLRYRFDPNYMDLCHPNSPNCFSGISCPDCNDTFNPSYEVDGQVVNFSNTPLVFNSLATSVRDHNVFNYEFSVYPNPVQDRFEIQATENIKDIKVLVYNVEGRGLKTYYFESVGQLNNYQFDVSNLSSGTYFVSIETKEASGVSKLIIQK